MRLRKILIFAVLLIFTLFCLVSCGDGPGPDPDPPENNAPTASAGANTTSAIVGDTVRLDASGSSDPDSDELKFNWTLDRPSGSNTTLSSPTAVNPWFVPDTATTSNEDYSAEVTVTEDTEDGLSDTDQVTVTAQKQLPETVTVPVENVAADGDSLITGTVTWKDSVVAEDVRSSEVAVPASRETGELCTEESDLFAEGCISVTPTSDISEMQEISVERKTVTYTINPDVPYGEQSAVAVSVSGSKVFEGSGSVDVPKLSASKSRVVSGNLETADQDNNSKIDRLYADTTVSSFENIDLTLALSRLDACSDGIDNDGDEFADESDTRACTDLDDNYDPEDDNEVLIGRTIVVGRYYDETKFVSSAEGERKTRLRGAINPLDPSVTVAKGPVDFALEVKVTEDTTGEDYTVHLNTGGSSDNLTVKSTGNIVVDQDTADGWVLKPIKGFDRTSFADGPHYAIYLWHGTEARGESFGDGKDRVYAYKGKKASRLYRMAWSFEPEDVPDDKAKPFKPNIMDQIATLGYDECLNTSSIDEICRIPASEEKQALTPPPFEHGVKRR